MSEKQEKQKPEAEKVKRADNYRRKTTSYKRTVEVADHCIIVIYTTN